MVNHYEIISYLYLFSKKIKQYVLEKYGKNISTLNVFVKKLVMVVNFQKRKCRVV